MFGQQLPATPDGFVRRDRTAPQRDAECAQSQRPLRFGVGESCTVHCLDKQCIRLGVPALELQLLRDPHGRPCQAQLVVGLLENRQGSPGGIGGAAVPAGVVHGQLQPGMGHGDSVPRPGSGVQRVGEHSEPIVAATPGQEHLGQPLSQRRPGGPSNLRRRGQFGLPAGPHDQ